MQHKIDWLSYTYYTDETPVEIPGHLLYATLTKHLPDYVNGDGITSMKKSARRGFNASYAIENHTYFHINTKGLILVEHTGQGCLLLEEKSLLQKLIADNADRVTRIDIATDICTDASVPMFAEMGKDNRVSASGFQHSATGETFYFGSKKSDRIVTVYRYYPPHPRSDWLRIEHRFKGKQGKQVAQMFADGYTVTDVALRANERMNWEHPSWEPEYEVDGEIAAWRPERSQNKTILWVHAQVVPALVKLVKAGDMTLDEIVSLVQESL